MNAIQTKVATEDRQYVTLGVDREVFAVDVRMVNEILDVPPIARLPNAPAYLLGMIDVRGRNVPVLDLRLKLGLPAKDISAQSRILVLEVEIDGHVLPFGLLADQVYEVTSLDGGEIVPPPEIGVRWRSDYINGVGRRKGSFVIVFDLAKLLGTDGIVLVAATESAG